MKDRNYGLTIIARIIYLFAGFDSVYHVPTYLCKKIHTKCVSNIRK